MDAFTSHFSGLSINDNKDMDTFTSLFKNLSLHVTDDEMESLTSNMESLKIEDNLVEITRKDNTVIHITKEELKITKDDVPIYIRKLFVRCGLEYDRPFEQPYIVNSF
jgi:hypothetical protein